MTESGERSLYAYKLLGDYDTLMSIIKDYGFDINEIVIGYCIEAAGYCEIVIIRYNQENERFYLYGICTKPKIFDIKLLTTHVTTSASGLERTYTNGFRLAKDHYTSIHYKVKDLLLDLSLEGMG